MKKLDVEFVSGDGGFSADPLTYKQLARTDNVALYERSRNGKVLDHEVIRIKILPKGTQIFKVTTEEDQERYPSTAQFSKIAFSIPNKSLAMARYEELCKQAKDATDDTVEPEDTTIVPDTEFTVGEFAIANGIEYPKAFLTVKAALETGSVKFVREERRNSRGKLSKIYARA
jgi:hypothetical protein